MVSFFLLLPLIVFLAQVKSIFLWGYLGLLEILIILACVNKLSYHGLKFECSNNKLRFKNGLFFRESIIICDKVVVVHTDKEKEDMDIIFITTTKFRNKYLRPINKGFLKRYPEATEEYIKIKKIQPEKKYYFQVVRRGALKKYTLLNLIFSNCVKASYTASAIENIKIAREQIEL